MKKWYIFLESYWKDFHLVWPSFHVLVSRPRKRLLLRKRIKKTEKTDEFKVPKFPLKTKKRPKMILPDPKEIQYKEFENLTPADLPSNLVYSMDEGSDSELVPIFSPERKLENPQKKRFWEEPDNHSQTRLRFAWWTNRPNCKNPCKGWPWCFTTDIPKRSTTEWWRNRCQVSWNLSQDYWRRKPSNCRRIPRVRNSTSCVLSIKSDNKKNDYSECPPQKPAV